MYRAIKTSLCAIGAIAVVATGVWASNIPLITGPIEPSAIVATVNSLTQRINAGVSGVNASLTTAYTTSTTGAETILAANIPGGQLAIGSTLHYFASGVNSADANVKTVTFNFGAATCAVVVTASGAKWTADAWFTVNAAATQASTCKGQQGTTATAVVQGTGTVSTTAAVTANIQLTAATSGTVQALQAWIDQIQ